MIARIILSQEQCICQFICGFASYEPIKIYLFETKKLFIEQKLFLMPEWQQKNGEKDQMDKKKSISIKILWMSIYNNYMYCPIIKVGIFRIPDLKIKLFNESQSK